MPNDEKLIESDIMDEIIKSLKQIKSDYAPFFSRLRGKYSKEQLASILNRLLEETTDVFVAKLLIIEISKLMHPDCLKALVDFILSRSNESFSTSVQGCELANVKVLCIKAIANYKDKTCVTPLLYCLNNKNENYKFRLAAAEALGKIGDKNAVEPLIDIVEDDEEKSVYVRESAAIALGMLGDMRAIEPFLGILSTKKGFLSKFAFLKERVIEALGKINFSGDSRVSDAFKDTLFDESAQIRLSTLESISNAQCYDMFEDVKELLKDENEDVAKSAVIVLYNLSDRQILDEIIADENTKKCCKEQAQAILDEFENGEDDDDY